jgi:hypothetical protein
MLTSETSEKAVYKIVHVHDTCVMPQHKVVASSCAYKFAPNLQSIRGPTTEPQKAFVSVFVLSSFKSFIERNPLHTIQHYKPWVLFNPVKGMWVGW